MKKIITCSFLFFLSQGSFAQMGIGTTSPDANAVLELSSTTQGMKFPRMTTSQRTSIALPAKGLTVFDTEINCLMTNFGTSSVPSWKCLGGLANSVPGAPTSPVATAIYKQATVSFTAPASNGGSAITGYTVTSTPGSFTATGASSPLTVTGLTNGTSYTFTVVATNATGNSVASSASTAVIPNCGAYVSAGVYKVFACYNLGVTGTQDALSYQSGANNGTLYQWGRQTDGHEVRTSATQAGPVSAPVESKFITNSTSPSDWISPQNNSLWLDASKTANDPCPEGFRVPTKAQWANIASGNTRTWTGYGYTVGANLYLPAAGGRNGSVATLGAVGTYGGYWSSTVIGTNASVLLFSSGGVTPGYDLYPRGNGFSVRCISE
jgi:hypothetical protein